MMDPAKDARCAQGERASGTDVKGAGEDGGGRADGDGGGGWFEMTAESHNSGRSPAGGGGGRASGRAPGRRSRGGGGSGWKVGGGGRTFHIVEVDESPRREINIAQRRRSPLRGHTAIHGHTYIHACERARRHVHVPALHIPRSGGRIYVHNDDDTYNAAADTFLSRPCPSTSSAPHVSPRRSLDSTPKDSLTLPA